jgi:hypothetical protein
MTNNFIQIDEKGNYFVITTGWNDLETRAKNFTGQYDFPKENTSANGLKSITGTGVENTGLSIINENTNKRISIRRTIDTTDADGNAIELDNEFFLMGEPITFDNMFEWLLFSTGITKISDR